MSDGPAEEVGRTLDLLAARWGSAGPLLAGFPLLARGRAVEVEEIAAAAGAEAEQVELASDAARCERDGSILQPVQSA